MAMKAELQKRQLIDRVAERVRQRMEADRADLAERFVREFYAHVPPDDIIKEGADNLYGAAMSLWSHAQVRKVGTAKVRVYNPRPDEHGWASTHSIVEIVNDDMPFLVDSVTAEIARAGAEVLLIIHPILGIARNGKGKIAMLGEQSKAAAGESFMHVQISEQPSERHGEIATGLSKVLADVRASVEDWRAMRRRLHAILGELQESPPPLPAAEIEQGIAFLNWMDDDHFTYLGYREYNFEGKGDTAVARIQADSGLGVLRDDEVSVFDGLRNLG
ncbi:MAG TPA: NAD-glutamate dehydrogenase, partial [Kiloniellales bacterium]